MLLRVLKSKPLGYKLMIRKSKRQYTVAHGIGIGHALTNLSVIHPTAGTQSIEGPFVSHLPSGFLSYNKLLEVN